MPPLSTLSMNTIRESEPYTKEKDSGLFLFQSPNLDSGLFGVVVAVFFDGRAGSPKNRNDGVDMSWRVWFV